MKKVAITGLIIALGLLIIPLFNIKIEKKTVKTLASAKEKVADETDNSEKSDIPDDTGTVFLIKTSDKIESVPAAEYVAGVVAAEMPASFNIEALKAQCVAAYTFALYRKNEGRYKEYDLTDSYKTDQSYINDALRREKWGEAYEQNSAKISEAVKSVLGEYLSFDDKPALTLYHALSAGVTNSCADVFGSQVQYLVSVDSAGDLLSPDYKSVFSFSEDDLVNKLSALYKPQNGGQNLFSDIKTAKSGLVLSLIYGEKTTSGGEIAKLLDLPSAAFDIEYSASSYTFTCVGRGHGVGMSQYGAQSQAAGGADYKEILFHYYPGTRLMKK